MASRDVENGIDLAIAALMQRDAQAGKPPTQEQLQVFEAAVRYLVGHADQTAFAPTDTDTQFAKTLKGELTPLPPAAAEAMGLSDVFSSIGDAMKSVTDRLRNAGSDAGSG